MRQADDGFTRLPTCALAAPMIGERFSADKD
jgi:hypothetical protein